MNGPVIPKEFSRLDKSRIHYVVIAGKRSDFSDKLNLLRRKYLKEQNIRIYHFDNLSERADGIIGNKTY